MKIVVGITGSSGAVYALDFLKKCPPKKFLITSAWGKVLLRDELKMGEKDLLPFVDRVYSGDDLTAPMASGSNVLDACVILPASTSTGAPSRRRNAMSPIRGPSSSIGTCVWATRRWPASTS